MVGSQVIQSSIDTFDVESGKKKNTSKLTKKDHWGRENYGLDYRDKIRNQGEGTVQNMMRKRAVEHNEQSAEAGECAPHKNIDATVTTIITSDGDDFKVKRTIPILKPHLE
jgi:hypothetical protein